MPDDNEQRDDLAATSESLKGDAERLVDIENEKQALDAADSRVDALSGDAERIAEQILQKSRIERDLADDIAPGDESPTRSH
ncbi:MAG TPA: hypothetical protein VMQ65_12060 [Candidatus Limnocylindria bacterium]|nr:hypothetical protein [Candidatus Limnocylindria bacterium]